MTVAGRNARWRPSRFNLAKVRSWTWIRNESNNRKTGSLVRAQLSRRSAIVQSNQMRERAKSAGESVRSAELTAQDGAARAARRRYRRGRRARRERPAGSCRPAHGAWVERPRARGAAEARIATAPWANRSRHQGNRARPGKESWARARRLRTGARGMRDGKLDLRPQPPCLRYREHDASSNPRLHGAAGWWKSGWKLLHAYGVLLAVSLR